MNANRVERSIRRRRRHGSAAITVSLLAAALAGCGGVNRSISSAPPESFEASEVVASKPLALPPDFAALPPSQAETGAQAGASPTQNRWNPLVSTEAAASVAGNSQVSRLPANQTPGEVALLQNAGAQSIDRDVRKKLQLETGLVEQDETMVDSLVLNEPVPSGPGATPDSEDAQSYALLSSTARGGIPAPGAAAPPAAGAPVTPPAAVAPAALQAPPGLKLPSLPARTAAAPAAQSPAGLPPPGLPTAAAAPPPGQSPVGLPPPSLPQTPAPAVQSPPPVPSAPAVSKPAAVAAASPPSAAGPLPRTLPPPPAGKEVTWGSGQRPPWLDEAADASAAEVAPAAVPASVSAPVAGGPPGAAPQSAPAAEPADDANQTRSTGDLQNLFD